MEGREQKHQMIAKYSENTTPQNRWSMIFRHEYLQLIYLRLNGYDDIKYLKKVIFQKMMQFYLVRFAVQILIQGASVYFVMIL